jgi:hypothetical protein
VKTRTRNLTLAFGAIGVLLATTAGSCDSASSQSKSQTLTDDITNSSGDTVKYPLADMKAGGWTERHMLVEHLQRQNNPKALRYITFITQQGQVVATYPVQGMVFDPNSQLTTTQMVNGCNSNCGAVTQAAGDNGTWGPEAGSAAFFTTSGVEIQVPSSMTWIESDAPLNLTTKPLITYDASAAPSVNAGGVKVGGR